jgi:hypothetical protein
LSYVKVKKALPTLSAAELTDLVSGAQSLLQIGSALTPQMNPLCARGRRR